MLSRIVCVIALTLPIGAAAQRSLKTTANAGVVSTRTLLRALDVRVRRYRPNNRIGVTVTEPV